MGRVVHTVLIAILLTSSCSVKEDRTGCPCRLDVFFEEVPSGGIVVAASGREMIFEDMVGGAASWSWKEYEVPKGTVNLYGSNIPGPVLIEVGDEADSIYACASTVDCSGETALDTIRLCKQFATLSICFLSVEGAVMQYEPVIRGNVCGLDLNGLELVRGQFRFSPAETAAGCYRVRIPRQADDSLAMDLVPVSGGKSADVVEIGKMIRAAGYDWSAADLEDISLVIDFAKMAITVKISPWTADFVYDVTI